MSAAQEKNAQDPTSRNGTQGSLSSWWYHTIGIALTGHSGIYLAE
jgi:hypothetical protein